MDTPTDAQRPEQDDASPQHRRGLVARTAITLATTILLLLTVAVGTIAVRRITDRTGDDDATGSSSRSPTTEPRVLDEPVSATGDPSFDSGVTEVARFVEESRGHPFLRPVQVKLADDRTFTRLLLADFADGADRLRTTQVALVALGVLPPGADLVEETRRALTIGVIGFYDPRTTQLVVRGTELSSFTRTTLAHELTHALDDQWFDLDRELDDPSDTDAAFGFLALVEGSASRVEDAWVASRPPEERGELMTEAREFARTMDTSGFSTTVVQILGSPYSLGLDLVTSIMANGGVEALDDAFRSPPISSEQVMHPERYRNHEAPREVTDPPAEGAALAVGTLGELDLTRVLSSSLAPAVARVAGEGWGGDRFVVWTTSTGRSCLRVDIVGDTAADSGEIAGTLQRWAAAQLGTGRPDAAVEVMSDGVTRLISCR